MKTSDRTANAKVFMNVEYLAAHIPISHELIADDPRHFCDASCPPLMPLPALSRRSRVSAWLRSIAWRIKRLPAYRLVHRDDIGCGCVDW